MASYELVPFDDISVPLPLVYRGKVRGVYEIPEHPDKRFMVASDRVSTHNMVHRTPIPGKGICLTMGSVLFFELMSREGIENHLVAYGKNIYRYVPALEGLDRRGSDFFARSMVVRKLDIIPDELVFRSMFAGSYWESYERGDPDPYGYSLPPGLHYMSPLERDGYPLFTPTEKSKTDAPVRASSVEREFPDAVDLARRAYGVIQRRYRAYNILLVDSKLESGRCEVKQSSGPPRRITFIGDEAGTQDCSRIVWNKNIRAGRGIRFLDKQNVRFWAEGRWGRGKRRPLVIPEDVARYFSRMYRDITELVTGVTLEEWMESKGQVHFEGVD